jgi:hypothetical protein
LPLYSPSALHVAAMPLALRGCGSTAS